MGREKQAYRRSLQSFMEKTLIKELLDKYAAENLSYQEVKLFIELLNNTQHRQVIEELLEIFKCFSTVPGVVFFLHRRCIIIRRIDDDPIKAPIDVGE